MTQRYGRGFSQWISLGLCWFRFNEERARTVGCCSDKEGLLPCAAGEGGAGWDATGGGNAAGGDATGGRNRSRDAVARRSVGEVSHAPWWRILTLSFPGL